MAKTLPLFAIYHLEDDTVAGIADASRWIGVGHIVALVLGDRFIWGKWRDGGQSGGSASIRLDNPTDAGGLRAGMAYPFIDSYWGDRAELVLDSSTSWLRSVFAPVDAVSVTHPGGSLITKVGPDDVSGQILAGAWDHEHCEVCYQKIGTGGQAAGWANSEKKWVCESCYVAYVAARSLEFVNVE
jgi:hypothetical protein